MIMFYCIGTGKKKEKNEITPPAGRDCRKGQSRKSGLEQNGGGNFPPIRSRHSGLSF